MARFDHLTETAGTPASREGLDMLYTRYDYVRTLAAGKRVLELACGSGQGLGLIAKSAKWTVGGDIDSTLLDRAARHYGSRHPLIQLSAESLPFKSGSFDLVVLLESRGTHGIRHDDDEQDQRDESAKDSPDDSQRLTH